jgi:hypothetical protein
MKDEPSKQPDHAHPIFTRQIGSAKARWKVTLRVRIFEVLQVYTSLDEEAGSDRDPIRAERSSKLDLRDEDAGGLRFDFAEIHLVAPDFQFDVRQI